MKTREVQRKGAHDQPAAQQRQGTVSLGSPRDGQITQLEAAADASPQGGRIAQLAAIANNNPTAAVQRRLIDGIHNGLRATAQRRQPDGLTGETAPREEAPQPEVAQREEAPAKPNNTGLPDNLKSGIESLSGISMDNVKVHYNSSQPAQLNAHAYAQGTDIHVAPGQEQHLPHEAWHVVQQAQGRVQPTMQMKGDVPINDDGSLEREADVMGEQASARDLVQEKSTESYPLNSVQAKAGKSASLDTLASTGFVPQMKVIQRLILVDDDMDVSRLAAAVHIYRKWANKGKPERISTTKRANLSNLPPGEKLYLVAHGDSENHGDRSASDLAKLLVNAGFPLGDGNVIKLISCNTGDGDEASYAARLGNILGRCNTVIGIRGPETSDKGHTRGSRMANADKVMGDYFKILQDPAFAAAEVIATKAKSQIEACPESEIPMILMGAYDKIDKLAANVTAKLEALFLNYVEEMSKEESEYKHGGLPQSNLARPIGPAANQPGDFNPDYPGLEFSF